MTTLRIALFTLLSLWTSIASAQATSAAAPIEPTSPPVRVDVDLPSMGPGTGSLGTALVTSVSVRVAGREGHGAYLSTTNVTTDATVTFGPHGPSVSGGLHSAGYLHRIRLAGDDRVGLGLDLEGGLTAASLDFHQPTSGLCFGSCGQPEPVDEHLADGWHLGANVGASLDLRAWGFLVGIDVHWHALAALEAQPGDRIDQHVVSAGLHLGFGIY